MAQAGDSVAQIAGWLRHRNLQSVERYLSDIDRESHEREMEKRMSKYFLPAGSVRGK
jgi:hypothetical protein